MERNRVSRTVVVALATCALGLVASTSDVRANDSGRILVEGAPDPGPGFTLQTTVMVDDGMDTCATENQVVVDAATMLRYCYTLINTGSEALNMHSVWDTRLGWVAGPDMDDVVEPGESLSITATGSETNSAFHKVTWTATGVDSGTEVSHADYLYITIDGTSVQLDMTAMVDDGQDTCGTETDLVVPAGTQVRICYSMTNTLDETVEVHLLLDEQIGVLLTYEGPQLDSGATLIHTEVATIDETVTHTGYWGAYAADYGLLGQAIDALTIEVGDGPPPTTTTVVPGVDPCATTTTVADVPTTTSPPTSTTTTTPTTTTTTTTTTSTTTTTTMPSFTTTTSTTSPVLVIPTTTTTLGEPAGFAGPVRDGGGGYGAPYGRPAVAPCPPLPPGGELPRTGSALGSFVVLAALLMLSGAAAVLAARGRSLRGLGLDRTS